MRTKNFTIDSLNGLYPKESAKMQEMINKTLSQWIKIRTNNIDCLVAYFIEENKCSPKDVVLVEKKTEFGVEYSVKHKNTSYKTHFKNLQNE